MNTLDEVIERVYKNEFTSGVHMKFVKEEIYMRMVESFEKMCPSTSDMLLVTARCKNERLRELYKRRLKKKLESKD